jgi:hypothetical protein
MRGFGIANYRSFSSAGAWLPELSKINIFIGKNNAGKSNALKFLRDLAAGLTGKPSGLSKEVRHWGQGDPPAIDIDVTLSELNWDWTNFGYFGSVGLPDSSTKLRIRYEIDPLRIGPIDPLANMQTNTKVYQSIWSRLGAREFPPPKEQISELLTRSQHFQQVHWILQREFKNVFYVQQFREIRDGDGKTDVTDERRAAGYKLAEQLGIMRNPGESGFAQQNEFYKIQEWIRELLDVPDLEIETEHPASARPNAVLLKANGLRRYLESFGTGPHQLILLCFAMSLKNNHIVCIEEPESFLHPTLQRRFLDFLRKTDNTYFLSTHSNVFLDASKHDDTRIYHVGYDGKASTITRVDTTPNAYRVLEDLGYHASDLLQSNGVIWVEGPTDRLYLLRWLELCGCGAKEGLDFAIMFYGGRLLSHLSFAADLEEEELIPLLRLNRNAIVILDSERTAKGQNLENSREELVKRIETELSEIPNSLVWVTEGRDIENYIAKDALEKFAKEKWNGEFRLEYDHFLHLDEMLKWGEAHEKRFNYSNAKVEWCRKIVPYLTQAHLDVLDLRQRLNSVASKIGGWCPKRVAHA